jgi:hypothetical protein
MPARFAGGAFALRAAALPAGALLVAALFVPALRAVEGFFELDLLVFFVFFFAMTFPFNQRS